MTFYMLRLWSDCAYNHDLEEINTPTRRRRRLVVFDEDEAKRLQRQDQDEIKWEWYEYKKIEVIFSDILKPIKYINSLINDIPKTTKLMKQFLSPQTQIYFFILMLNNNMLLFLIEKPFFLIIKFIFYTSLVLKQWRCQNVSR